jgi:hypothetical protein
MQSNVCVDVLVTLRSKTNETTSHLKELVAVFLRRAEMWLGWEMDRREATEARDKLDWHARAHHEQRGGLVSRGRSGECCPHQSRCTRPRLRR